MTVRSRLACPHCQAPYPLWRAIIRFRSYVCPRCKNELAFTIESAQRLGAVGGLVGAVVRKMKQSLYIVAFIAVAFGLNGATPYEPRPDPIVIKIADMNREWVGVRTPNGEQGAHLIFFFERKTKQQVDHLFFRQRRRPVHVMDGQQLLTECRAIGISSWNSPKKARYGLILGFDTVEEAEQLARAIRPFLR